MTAIVLPDDEWTPEYAAAYVTESYAKSVLAVIETGQRLAEAKSNLPHGQWLPFVELLPFSERTAQRFMVIAAHPELANPTHVSHLPSSWGTLATLAQLPAGEIETRIAAGELTPETPRHQAEEWARIYQMGRQEAVNAWSDACDGLTRALAYFKNGNTPPANLPASHVQPAEFIERLDALNHITEEIRNG